MLVALIIIPAIIVAVGVVLLLDRVGVLPRLDGGPSSYSSRSSGGGGFLDSIPKGALWGAGGLMIVWILAWLLFLIIGLSVLAG
jgi:hypothetical protein